MTKAQQQHEEAVAEIQRIDAAIQSERARLMEIEAAIEAELTSSGAKRAEAVLSGGKAPSTSSSVAKLRTEAGEIRATVAALGQKHGEAIEHELSLRAGALEHDAQKKRTEKGEVEHELAEVRARLAALESRSGELAAGIAQDETQAAQSRLRLRCPLEFWTGAPGDLAALVTDPTTSIDSAAADQVLREWRAEQTFGAQRGFVAYGGIAFERRTGKIVRVSVFGAHTLPDGAGNYITGGGTSSADQWGHYIFGKLEKCGITDYRPDDLRNSSTPWWTVKGSRAPVEEVA